MTRFAEGTLADVFEREVVLRLPRSVTAALVVIALARGERTVRGLAEGLAAVGWPAGDRVVREAVWELEGAGLAARRRGREGAGIWEGRGRVAWWWALTGRGMEVAGVLSGAAAALLEESRL